MALDKARLRLVELEQECKDIGRDFSTIEITCSARMDPDHIKRLQDVGVHRVTFPTAMLGGGGDVFKGLDNLAALSEKI